jgi:hypothetical protein
MSVYDKVIEDVPPRFIRRQGDLVQEGSNKTLLVLGTDRPAGAESGLGHSDADGGGKNTATVHIIAGRKDADPNFKTDSSFIYISQRTNADNNLNLPNLVGGTTTTPAPNEAAAIIKSDNIRVVFRDSGDVRIVNEAGSSFIVISKDYIDGYVESDVWLDAGGTKFEVHSDRQRVRLGPLADALADLADRLFDAFKLSQSSGTGNLGAPVLFSSSDLKENVTSTLDDWKRTWIEGDYLKGS